MAKNARPLLLEEVISIQFDQNLPQGENWPAELKIQLETEDKQKSEEEVRSEVFILCGVTVTFRVLSWSLVMKRYSYSKVVLQLIVVLPAEHAINRFI
jgi:hypothetical protein